MQTPQRVLMNCSHFCLRLPTLSFRGYDNLHWMLIHLWSSDMFLVCSAVTSISSVVCSKALWVQAGKNPAFPRASCATGGDGTPMGAHTGHLRNSLPSQYKSPGKLILCKRLSSFFFVVEGENNPLTRCYSEASLFRRSKRRVMLSFLCSQCHLLHRRGNF